MNKIPQTNRVYYKAGYKYQTCREYMAYINQRPAADIHTEYVDLFTDGLLVVRRGYCWDGASGPTIDTKSSQRGSLEHDVIYQLIRMGLLPQSARVLADDQLEKTMITDRAFKLRACLWEKMVRIFARGSTDPSAERPELVAP